MVVDLDFEINRFFPVVSELVELLDVKFVPGDPSNNTPIGRALHDIHVFQNNDDLFNRDGHYLRMLGLAKHLREVERHSPSTLGVFRRKLTDPDRGNFFGTRFEVQIAASLARSGMSFTVRTKGGPDFVMEPPYAGLGIECSSLHQVDSAKSIYALEKVRTRADEKASKPYAVRTNALALDVTNLHAVCKQHGNIPPADPRNLDELVKIVNRSGFGSLLMFWWRMTVEDGRITRMMTKYARIDSDHIDPKLEDFLNRTFSAKSDGQAEPDKWIVPSMP